MAKVISIFFTLLGKATSIGIKLPNECGHPTAVISRFNGHGLGCKWLDASCIIHHLPNTAHVAGRTLPHCAKIIDCGQAVYRNTHPTYVNKCFE